MSEAITQSAAYDLIDRFLRNNLYDDYAKYSDALEALSQPAPAPQPAVPVVEAFAEGWRMAADWANRDDLLPDMDSPQYAKERDERLAELRPAVEPMTSEQMADAIEHLCANREIAEILAANSADEYRAIAAKAGGGA